MYTVIFIIENDKIRYYLYVLCIEKSTLLVSSCVWKISHYVAQAGLKLRILLLQPLKYSDYIGMFYYAQLIFLFTKNNI